MVGRVVAIGWTDQPWDTLRTISHKADRKEATDERIELVRSWDKVCWRLGEVSGKRRGKPSIFGVKTGFDQGGVGLKYERLPDAWRVKGKDRHRVLLAPKLGVL